MHNTFIAFITGPMVWISAFIFSGGLLIKFFTVLWSVKRKESYIFSYFSFKYGLRSLGAWIIPFLPESSRLNPVYYVVSYLFHILLFAIPLFLASHIVLFNEAFQMPLFESFWPVLNDQIADWLSILLILFLIFFAVRRLMVPEVKYLTTIKDFLFLLVILVPFITGVLAYHQFFAYRWMIAAHILSGELMLIIIPFSRFSHMLTGILTRAYTGSEFGRVRRARDW